jgi:hypothetical protein
MDCFFPVDRRDLTAIPTATTETHSPIPRCRYRLPVSITPGYEQKNLPGRIRWKTNFSFDRIR